MFLLSLREGPEHIYDYLLTTGNAKWKYDYKKVILEHFLIPKLLRGRVNAFPLLSFSFLESKGKMEKCNRKKKETSDESKGVLYLRERAAVCFLFIIVF